MLNNKIGCVTKVLNFQLTIVYLNRKKPSILRILSVVVSIKNCHSRENGNLKQKNK